MCVYVCVCMYVCLCMCVCVCTGNVVLEPHGTVPDEGQVIAQDPGEVDVICQ